MCSVCIANGERHHKHAVISTKDAAGDAKAAVEGYMKAAQSFAKEAEGHNKALNSKLQGSALVTFVATAAYHKTLVLLMDVVFCALSAGRHCIACGGRDQSA